MQIGTKVRLKSGQETLMTVTRKTSQGYLVCTWLENGQRRERMFFPELVQHDSVTLATNENDRERKW